jgi:hypothetical protein
VSLVAAASIIAAARAEARWQRDDDEGTWVVDAASPLHLPIHLVGTLVPHGQQGNFYRDWQVTDEQRKLAERLREQERARMEPVLREYAEAVAAASPLAAAVLDLHKPVGPWPHCNGCDMEGYEAEWPEFPCRTYTLVKEWRE